MPLPVLFGPEATWHLEGDMLLLKWSRSLPHGCTDAGAITRLSKNEHRFLPFCSLFSTTVASF
jgi:hypothetical protein